MNTTSDSRNLQGVLFKMAHIIKALVKERDRQHLDQERNHQQGSNGHPALSDSLVDLVDQLHEQLVSGNSDFNKIVDDALQNFLGTWLNLYNDITDEHHRAFANTYVFPFTRGGTEFASAAILKGALTQLIPQWKSVFVGDVDSYDDIYSKKFSVEDSNDGSKIYQARVQYNRVLKDTGATVKSDITTIHFNDQMKIFNIDFEKLDQ